MYVYILDLCVCIRSALVWYHNITTGIHALDSGTWQLGISKDKVGILLESRVPIYTQGENLVDSWV